MPDTGEHWARTFEKLLDKYRRDDGSRWTGAALERATKGIVTQRWVSAMRSGDIGDPSYMRIEAVSRVIGASLDEWSIYSDL